MIARTRRTLLKTAAAAVAAPLVLPAVGRAQGSWPSKPIRCIVPLPPGGGTDTIGRRAMQRLSEALGVPVVVENRAGAGGTIGSDVVAKAEPDGYTIGIATASSHSAAPVFRKDLPYDPVKSFTAITMLGTTPYILIGGPAAGATDLAGFIAAAKAKPGKVTCASVGVSTLGYLLTKQFELLAGIEMVDVPYKGSALAYPDLMSGTVAVMLDNPSGSAGLVREGRLTGFAVTRPSPVLPNVPTFESLGVKGFDAVFWYGVVAPAGLPPAIADRIQKALAEGFLTDQGAASLRAMDVEPVMSTPAVFAAAMAKQTSGLARAGRSSRHQADGIALLLLRRPERSRGASSCPRLPSLRSGRRATLCGGCIMDGRARRFKVNELTPDPDVQFDPKVTKSYVTYAHRLAARGLVNSSVGGMVIRVAHPGHRARRVLRQAPGHQPGRGRGGGSGHHRHPVRPHPARRAGDHGRPSDEPRDPAPAARRQLRDPPAPRRDDRLHGGGLRRDPLLQPDLRLPDAEAGALPAGQRQRRGGRRRRSRPSSRTPTASS